MAHAGTKMQNKMYLMISSLLPNTLSLKNIRRSTPCHPWWIKWFISRCNHDTATINESSLASSRSDGHVTLPYIYAGAGWAYDYGTSQDSKEMFEYIKGYHQYKT
jgi:hypothetical protein